MSILDEKREEIAAFCKANGIEYLGVFGSYARGDYRDDSDVDCLVKFTKVKDLFDFVRVRRELGELLGTDIDLATEKALDKYIKETVLDEVQVVYEMNPLQKRPIPPVSTGGA